MAAAKGEKPESKTPPEPAVTVQAASEVEEPIPGEGITGFTVTAGLSEDYGANKTGTTLHYTFGRAVQPVDLVQPITEMRELCSELELEHHEQHVARAAAELHAATQQVQAPQGGPIPAPAATQAHAPPRTTPDPQTGVPWAYAAKPNGGGTLRYIPSNLFSTELLKDHINTTLRGMGYDPGEFEVYDNRVGQYGLESGNSSYSIAAVKPVEGSSYAGAVGRTASNNLKAAFYVEFNDDGSLNVKPSTEFSKALGL